MATSSTKAGGGEGNANTNAHGTNDKIHINVGGTLFCIKKDMIMRHPETMLGVMVSERWEKKNDSSSTENNGKEEYYIDRDPTRFKYILDFYRDGGVDGKIVIPLTISKPEMMKEIQYFALPLTDTDIDYDPKELGNIRKALTRFERQKITTWQEEANERAAVACAYELAALFLDTARCNGKIPW